MQYAAALVVILSAGADRARAQDSARSDSLREKRTSLVALPYAFYSPETKFAFGGGGIYSFRPGDSGPADRPSSVKIAITYTQLNQMILALMPEIYLMDEQYYFNGFYGYYKYPNRFWGIGGDAPDGAEEDYEQNDFESSTTVQRQIAPGLFAGVRYQYQYMSPEELSTRGVLKDGTIRGSEPGAASGLGIVINHDTRNHVFHPSGGWYNQFSAVFFGPAAGSDYTFTSLSIDLRKYFSLFGSHVLAFQTYDTFIIGDPPFQMLSLLGGSYCMRGYYRGRYRDKSMATLQAEYRFPLYWRFGAAGFAGIGDVADDIGAFRLDQFKCSLGFGLRFMFDRQEKINARLDVGFGKRDNAGVYAMVLEAF